MSLKEEGKIGIKGDEGSQDWRGPDHKEKSTTEKWDQNYSFNFLQITPWFRNCIFMELDNEKNQAENNC